MNDRRIGKPSPSRLMALLGGNFGAPCGETLVAPGPGLDAAVLSLAGGQVMAIAEDPIFPAPGLPLDLLGWFTVHIGASDIAVTGIRPRFMTYTLLLPPTCPESDVLSIVASISDTARELGISILGGHTGWYDAVTIPTVGGVTVWGFAEQSKWISPGGAQNGDVILMTKGPAIEAAALLAVLYKDELTDKISKASLDQALGRVHQITVVKDALSAFDAGGVNAMHDATEGGILGGIHEMAAAANLPALVNLDNIDIPSDIQSVARALNFDPWCAISEGSLLASVKPERVPQVQEAWLRTGIVSYELGRFDEKLECCMVVRNGTRTRLAESERDPFWDLFFAGLRQSAAHSK